MMHVPPEGSSPSIPNTLICKKRGLDGLLIRHLLLACLEDFNHTTSVHTLSSDVIIEMRDDSANKLEDLTHEERKPLKTVKSSLKGSSSQLSLEKVAIEARKNAARRQTRNRAEAILQGLLHSAEKARKARGRRKSLSLRPNSFKIDPTSGLAVKQPQAVVIACTDCDLPLPETFGTAALDVIVLRSKGNFATPEVASDVALAVQDSGARLIMVLGHTQCSAIDVAVDRWLEKKSSAWPWPSRTPRREDEKEGISLEDDSAARLQAPAKTQKPSIDPENRPANQPSEPTRTDKFSMTGNVEDHGIWKSLFSCYCGADMTQDESHHSRSSPSNAPSPDVSQHAEVLQAYPSNAMLNCSDRTVVLSLGNTLEAAVDEVALERLKIEEAERESLAAEAPLPEPERNPIEAPRARRCDSDISTSVRTRSEQQAADQKEAAVIQRDNKTALEVTNANAKLAAEALLHGLAKRVSNNIMHELEVVAVTADVDTAKLSLLRKGWYQHATYFFE